jgi:hypothetical protein
MEANPRPNTAEQALKEEQFKPQYSLNLLNIVASQPLPAKTRLAAALAFKNFIRNNYVVRTPLPHTNGAADSQTYQLSTGRGRKLQAPRR